MNGDSEIVHHLPEIFSEVKHDCYKAVGAGIVCYLTYRLLRYISIRNSVAPKILLIDAIVVIIYCIV